MTNTTKISKWVQSAHHRIADPSGGLKSIWSHNISREVLWVELSKELPRIKKTKKKIESLMNSMKGPIYQTSDYDDTKMHVELLHDAIGIYEIPSFADGNSYLWSRPDKDQDDLPYVGSVWFDYLGNPSIRLNGGYILLMLSDEGVEYLNWIARIVSCNFYFTHHGQN